MVARSGAAEQCIAGVQLTCGGCAGGAPGSICNAHGAAGQDDPAVPGGRAAADGVTCNATQRRQDVKVVAHAGPGGAYPSRPGLRVCQALQAKERLFGRLVGIESLAHRRRRMGPCWRQVPASVDLQHKAARSLHLKPQPRPKACIPQMALKRVRFAVPEEDEHPSQAKAPRRAQSTASILRK